jgi:exonuclease VII small subunit
MWRSRCNTSAYWQWCNGTTADDGDDDDDGDDNGKNKGRSICPNNNPMAYAENNCSTSGLDRVTLATSSAAALSSLSGMSFFSTVCSTVFTYAAFLSGTASINKNVENLHKKSDIYNAEAKLDRAKAELDRAEAKLDRAKAELRDAEAKLDRAKSELDRTVEEVKKIAIRVTITEFELGVEKARTSFVGLSEAFGRGSDVDPHDEKNEISSKAKLLGDIATARSKLPNQVYTPPPGATME